MGCFILLMAIIIVACRSIVIASNHYNNFRLLSMVKVPVPFALADILEDMKVKRYDSAYIKIKI